MEQLVGVLTDLTVPAVGAPDRRFAARLAELDQLDPVAIRIAHEADPRAAF